MTSYVLVNVTVPARVRLLAHHNKSPKERTVGGDSTAETVAFAPEVRDYIVENPELEWISEEPFLNGKAWWVSFEFSCSMGYGETCVEGLRNIGVGDEEDGRGMIHVFPVYIRHVGSRPKACGRPESLPFSAPSPHVSPRGPSLRKRPQVPILEVESGDEKTPGSPETEEMTQDMEAPDSPHSGVTFVDDEYDDGAELENETERLQAKLIAEVEAAEGKKDTLQKYTENFADTVKSRVAVDSLVQYCYAASEFSFDYVMLCVIAAIIACVGLVTNNQVVIVASMLVSPLMGPILAQTLGSVLSDIPLVKRGFFSEGVGLFICLMVGFIGGLCSAPLNGDEWPTDEMASRAVVSSLYIGVAIAIPSGAGAALSVTGNNTSSLVGVAISASLLPPVVNAGILFAAAALRNNENWINNPNYVSGSYPTDNPAMGGLISFLVTVVNIVCIYFSAYLMFEFKEVRGANTFWKEDIGKARKYNKAVRADSGVASVYEKAFRSAAQRKRNSPSAHRTYDGMTLSPIEKIRTGWKVASGNRVKEREE